jgi:hypothetical protein
MDKIRQVAYPEALYRKKLSTTPHLSKLIKDANSKPRENYVLT